jgi:hypothetical protein
VDGADPAAFLGSGAFAVRSGDRWTFTALPAVTQGMPMRVNGLWQLTERQSWIVGAGGAMALFATDAGGTSLSPASIDGGFDERALLAVDGSGPNQGWAVGEAGKVLRLRDGRWAPPSPPLPTEVMGLRLPAPTLTDVDVLGDEVVILGNDPAGGRFVTMLYRFDGAAWTTDLLSGVTSSTFERTPDGTLYLAREDRLYFRRRGDLAWSMTDPLPGSLVSLRARATGSLDVLMRGARDAAAFEVAPGGVAVTPLGPRIPTNAVTALHRGADGALWVAGGGVILRYLP